MPKRGEKFTDEQRARISEGTRRALRPWKDGLHVLPSDIRGFLQRGQVAESLRPMASAAVELLGDYTSDLGDDLTAGQRAALASLYRSVVVSNAMFAEYLRTGDRKALEGLPSMMAAERQTLALLGLARRAREIDWEAPVSVEWGGSAGQGERASESDS